MIDSDCSCISTLEQMKPLPHTSYIIDDRTGWVGERSKTDLGYEYDIQIGIQLSSNGSVKRQNNGHFLHFSLLTG